MDLPFREVRETTTVAAEAKATRVVDPRAGGDVIGVVMVVVVVVVVVVRLVTTMVIMDTWLGIRLRKKELF